MTAGLSYKRVVPVENAGGVSSEKDGNGNIMSSADATMQKHNDILRQKKENLRRLLEQSSSGSMKMSSSPDLINNKREEMKEQRSLSFDDRSSPLKNKVESAPRMPNLNDSPRSSSPTSVEGISNETTQQSPHSSRSKLSSSSSSKKKREPKIKIFVLLLQPSSRIFELIQIVYNPASTTIGDVLALIPANATEQELGAQEHRGFCRPMDGVEMADTTMLASGRRRANCARIHRGEILVAIPRGHTGPDCMKLAQPILQNPKLIKLLSQSNPKKSRRGSRSRRSAPGSAGRMRRQRSTAALPIETVIEEGDEDDEDMEDVASDLYSVGSEREAADNYDAYRRNSSSAVQMEATKLPVHQEDDDDDSSVVSTDSSIASSALAREIEELAESQAMQETIPHRAPRTVEEQTPSITSVSTPPRQAMPPPSTSPPASPVIGKALYRDNGEIDCVEIGRLILTQTKRAVRICIRRSIEYYAFKSKEWNKRRRKRHTSLLPSHLIWMCLLAMTFMVSVNKFTSDPQAENMAISTKEASFGVFGLVKIFVILFVLAEGQRNIRVLHTEASEKSSRRASFTRTNSTKFRSMRKSPSAVSFRPMMDFDDNDRSASLSPRRKGNMYMNDWNEAANMY